MAHKQQYTAKQKTVKRNIMRKISTIQAFGKAKVFSRPPVKRKRENVFAIAKYKDGTETMLSMENLNDKLFDFGEAHRKEWFT